jgi:hypothetical protein
MKNAGYITTSTNKVENLGNGYLLKTYVNAANCEREYAAANLFKQMVPDCVPDVIRVGEKACLIENIIDAQEAFELINRGEITMREVCEFATEFVERVYQTVNAGNLHWINCMPKCLQITETDLNEFSGVAPPLYSGFGAPITLLHRDLHLSNLLFKADGRGYVIDFEKACFGCKNSEFANSAYYNDAKSLDTALLPVCH